MTVGPGVLTIDLGAIQANWRTLSKLVAPAECAAVVKADAYGLGAEQVIPALGAAGCRTFFVATLAEGIQARQLAPSARVFVLNGLIDDTAIGPVRQADVIPVLSTLAEVTSYARFARASGRRWPAALHLDSGLNRLGLSARDVSTLSAMPDVFEPLDIVLVMSHLASADDPADRKNAAQRSAFDVLRCGLPAAPASLAASDGLMLGAHFHYDVVRPGYALYGGQAFGGGPTPVAPVVTLAVRVLQVREVAVGETVGYSATWTAQRPSRIAVLAAGYADGLPRTLSAGTGREASFVRIKGHRAPLIGRVSMDLVTVDVTSFPDRVERGDLAMVLEPHLSIEQLARAGDTIGYEILTRLGRRFERNYVEGTA